MLKLLIVPSIIVLFSSASVVSSAIRLEVIERQRSTASGEYRPVHKGAVDLATGLYIRENDDLFIPGSPTLVLRRTYLAKFRASREFGIGTTHPGEDYLIGDGLQFQWASLILARGTRINFRRTTPGTSILNAVLVHDESPSEWHGAKLRWTLLLWTLRRSDGTILTFKGCGKGTVCSIIQRRDHEGRVTNYRRDIAGTLLKIDDGGDRSIAFEYDERHRISRARASTGEEVRYDYDDGGRLTRAVSSGGLVRSYTYTDLDELATIEEPGTSIENRYTDGRCVRQINRYPDRDPYVFDFAYQLRDGRLLRTETRTSDGGVRQYTWDDRRYVVEESLGQQGYQPLVFVYERDPASRGVTGLTVRCPDLGRGLLVRSRAVSRGEEERAKAHLATECLLDAAGK